MPMPTFTLAVAPLMPLMLPRTRALLSATSAYAPMAVALVRSRLGGIRSGDRNPTPCCCCPLCYIEGAAPGLPCCCFRWCCI